MSFRLIFKLAATMAIVVFATISAQAFQSSRETINVVGSSTVYPFTTVVAERFGKTSGFKTPRVESTGTGSGLKLFCSGVGVQTPDISNASRRMKKTEFEMCKANGVGAITEVLIGFDGIVIANAKNAEVIDIALKDLFLALAKRVPSADGKSLIDNPYKRWSDVNPKLPAHEIEVLGPAPTSGTRDAFSELVMEGGCRQFTAIAQYEKSDPIRFKQICHSVREDHKYIEVGENDNLIVQKLMNNANALGIFGFSFLDQNADKLQGASINGVKPDFSSIANGHYAISRPLYFYVKNLHAGKIPGIRAFLNEFTSDAAMGPEGYLSEKGLIPLPASMLQMVRVDVSSLKPLEL